MKEIFEEHVHRKGLEPGDLMVEVADRKTASGVRVLNGEQILAARGGFLELRDGGSVPYHKVRRMTSRGSVRYDRQGGR